MLFESINTVSIILFVVGMVLLLIELFVPGFGIFGGLGLVALVLCIVFQAQSVLEALILLLGIGAIVVALAIIAARSLKRGWLYRSPLVLKDSEEREAGYVSNEDYSHLAGHTGISITPLRPAGVAEFDNRKADVVTEGEFIPARSSITVTRVVGSRIIVKELEDSK
jgi:membrane-bound serine protease (ClpP class)